MTFAIATQRLIDENVQETRKMKNFQWNNSKILKTSIRRNELITSQIDEKRSLDVSIGFQITNAIHPIILIIKYESELDAWKDTIIENESNKNIDTVISTQFDLVRRVIVVKVSIDKIFIKDVVFCFDFEIDCVRGFVYHEIEEDETMCSL